MESSAHGDVTGSSASGSTSESSGFAQYQGVLRGVAGVIAPVTLLTAIAFFFGWSRVSAYDEYFGVNPSMVGYSTRDYVLNSLQPLFVPVLVVLSCLIVLGLAHALVKHVDDSGNHRAELRRIADLSLLVGGIVFVVGAFAVFRVIPVPYLLATLLPAAGALLLVYGIGLRRRLQGLPPLSTGVQVLVGLLVAICLFWSAGLYAGTVGRNEAAALAGNLEELPGVVVSGKSTSQLPANSGGWRLFAASNGSLFLIPQTWTPSSGAAIVEVPQSGAQVAVTPGAEPVPSGALGMQPGVSATSPTPAVIDITVAPKRRPEGGVATFVVTVTNQTGGPLYDVKVADPKLPACGGSFHGATANSASRSYTCTVTHVSKPFTNVWTVVGKNAHGKRFGWFTTRYLR